MASADKWKPVELPYRKADDILPIRLPTTQEIRTSNAILNQRTGQIIVAVTPEIVVKYGRSTKEREGQTLVYLEKYLPQVPAPRLYAMYYDSGDLFILMERIPGIRLDLVWSNLSEIEKQHLTANLRTVFEDIRQATCPWPFYSGAADGGPIPHHLFYSPDGNASICGPFKSETDFNSGLIAQYKSLKKMNNDMDFKGYFYTAHLGEVLRGHKSTFTHADVQRKNILLVDRNQQGVRQLGNLKVAIVDWEDAGWYPSYWEYFAAFVGFRWNDDWCETLEGFLPAWPAEVGVMKMIYTDLFF